MSVVHIYVIFLSLYIFEQIFFDFIVNQVLILLVDFKSDLRLFHIFGRW